MQRRDLSGRARADKLDPSIIVEDLLHRRGGAQRAAILACERRSSFHPIRTSRPPLIYRRYCTAVGGICSSSTMSQVCALKNGKSSFYLNHRYPFRSQRYYSPASARCVIHRQKGRVSRVTDSWAQRHESWRER